MICEPKIDLKICNGFDIFTKRNQIILLFQVENSLSTYEPHACIVVYSVVSKASFQHAEETLNYLWREGYTHEKSVIVVGNKSDLARARVISANGKKYLSCNRALSVVKVSNIL